MEYISNGFEDTLQIGRDFAKTLVSGDTVALIGDLGAGKTAFTAGVVSGLGISDYVSSPTFTIVNVYSNGNAPVFHFDLYRLSHEDDLYDIGIDEYLDGSGICIFEWPQLLESVVKPLYCVEITKDLSVSEDYRKINITKSGNCDENIGD